MMTGSLQHDELRRFLSQTPAFERAFDWIDRFAASSHDGIVKLDGADLYVNVHGYDTKRRDDCRWESHRRTADIQVCLSGGELIDWSPASPTGPSTYDAGREFESWPEHFAQVETISLDPARFVIFLPGELHRPVIANDRDTAIRKLVVKIAAHRLVPDASHD
jgi:YhcH/YjgK/YiaL family protein